MLACAVSCSGCTISSTAPSETAEVIISSGSAYYCTGCTVTAPDGSRPSQWSGPVYILPAATYEALLLTP